MPAAGNLHMQITCWCQEYKSYPVLPEEHPQLLPNASKGAWPRFKRPQMAQTASGSLTFKTPLLLAGPPLASLPRVTWQPAVGTAVSSLRHSKASSTHALMEGTCSSVPPATSKASALIFLYAPFGAILNTHTHSRLLSSLPHFFGSPFK